MTTFAADKILLYVHGATYPSETAFDLPIEGASMMDLIAARGYDVYLVDIRATARSTRPPEMSAAARGQPADRLDRGCRARLRRGGGSRPQTPRRRQDQSDGLVVGHRDRRAYTPASTTTRSARLVLFAPLWIFRNDAVIAPAPEASATSPPPLGAYRLVSKEVAKARWLEGVPEDKQRRSHSARRVRGLDRGDLGDRSGCREAPSADAARAQRRDRRRAGDYWAAGKAYYDPGKITVPTFLHSRRMGFRSAELSGAGIFRAVEERAVQAAGRNRRRHPHGDAGEEPHAVLPRDHAASSTRKSRWRCVA